MKIKVSVKWLNACGRARWEGFAFPVTSIIAMRGEEKMYNVITPEGHVWAVWSIRGVTIEE